MFNFSGGELFLVAVVTVIVIGPKQIPALTEQFGRWLKKYRDFTVRAKTELDKLEKQQQLMLNKQRAQTADAQYDQKTPS